MYIMAVDDEFRALNSFLRVLREVEPEADIAAFTESEEAFAHLAQHPVDVAFLDIKMGGLTGIQLAKKCSLLRPSTNVIFVTGYSEYALDALKLHASGYLMKPVRAEDLRAELANLRVPLPQPEFPRVNVRTFGNFDVFLNDKPLLFPTAKCKEALAYLVDRRGARTTYSELAGILWEDCLYDRSLQNNLHGTIFKLMKAISAAGIAEIVIKGRKDIAIIPSRINCDYYAALDGRGDFQNTFLGEYMSNYSWAEPTLSELNWRLKNSGRSINE